MCVALSWTMVFQQDDDDADEGDDDDEESENKRNLIGFVSLQHDYADDYMIR